jgi:hypothetical protein
VKGRRRAEARGSSDGGAGCKGLENDGSLPERAWLGEPVADEDCF